jgi:hypothetical protein
MAARPSSARKNIRSGMDILRVPAGTFVEKSVRLPNHSKLSQPAPLGGRAYCRREGGASSRVIKHAEIATRQLAASVLRRRLVNIYAGKGTPFAFASLAIANHSFITCPSLSFIGSTFAL